MNNRGRRKQGSQHMPAEKQHEEKKREAVSNILETSVRSQPAVIQATTIPSDILLPTAGAQFHVLTAEEFAERLSESMQLLVPNFISTSFYEQHAALVKLLYSSYLYFVGNYNEDQFSASQAQEVIDYFPQPFQQEKIQLNGIMYRAIILAYFRLNKIKKALEIADLAVNAAVIEGRYYNSQVKPDVFPLSTLFFLKGKLMLLSDGDAASPPVDYDGVIACLTQGLSKGATSLRNKAQICETLMLYQLCLRKKHGLHDVRQRESIADYENKFLINKRNAKFSEAITEMEKMSAWYIEMLPWALLRKIELLELAGYIGPQLTLEVFSLYSFCTWLSANIQSSPKEKIHRVSIDMFIIVARCHLRMLASVSLDGIEVDLYERLTQHHDELIATCKSIEGANVDAKQLEYTVYENYKELGDYFLVQYQATWNNSYLTHAERSYRKAVDAHKKTPQEMSDKFAQITQWQSGQTPNDVPEGNHPDDVQRQRKVKRQTAGKSNFPAVSKGHKPVRQPREVEEKINKPHVPYDQAARAAKILQQQQRAEKLDKHRAARLVKKKEDKIKGNKKANNKANKPEIEDSSNTPSTYEIRELSWQEIRAKQLAEAKAKSNAKGDEISNDIQVQKKVKPPLLPKLANSVRAGILVNLTALDLELLAVVPEGEEEEGINAIFGGTAMNRMLETEHELTPGTLDDADTDLDMQTGYAIAAMKTTYEQRYGLRLISCYVSEYDPSLLRMKIRVGDKIVAMDVKHNPGLTKKAQNFHAASHNCYATCVSNFITIDRKVHDGTGRGFDDLMSCTIRTVKPAKELFDRVNPSTILNTIKLRARLEFIVEKFNLPLQPSLADDLQVQMIVHTENLKRNPGQTNVALKKIFFHKNTNALRDLFHLDIFKKLFPEFMVLFERDQYQILFGDAKLFYEAFFAFLNQARNNRNTSLFIVYDFLLMKLKALQPDVDLEQVIAQNPILQQQYNYIVQSIAKKPSMILNELERATTFALPLQHRVLTAVAQNIDLLPAVVQASTAVCAEVNRFLKRLFFAQNKLPLIEMLLDFSIFEKLFPELKAKAGHHFDDAIRVIFTNNHSLGDVYKTLCMKMRGLKMNNPIVHEFYRSSAEQGLERLSGKIVALSRSKQYAECLDLLENISLHFNAVEFYRYLLVKQLLQHLFPHGYQQLFADQAWLWSKLTIIDQRVPAENRLNCIYGVILVSLSQGNVSLTQQIIADENSVFYWHGKISGYNWENLNVVCEDYSKLRPQSNQFGLFQHPQPHVMPLVRVLPQAPQQFPYIPAMGPSNFFYHPGPLPFPPGYLPPPQLVRAGGPMWEMSPPYYPPREFKS